MDAQGYNGQLTRIRSIPDTTFVPPLIVWYLPHHPYTSTFEAYRLLFNIFVPIGLCVDPK